MAGLDLNVVVTGTEKLDELIKKLKTTGTASESMIKSFNAVSTIFKDVGNEVTSLVARVATLEKENKKLTTSATTAAAAQDKLKISLASVSAAAMGSLADINKMSSALAKQTLELSTVSKQTALLVTSQHSLANSSKGLAAVTYERLAAYQAEKAALSQLNSLVATHTGLMGTRKNLETGVTAAMQKRIALEQAEVAIQKQLNGLSVARVQAMQMQAVAASSLSVAQKNLALQELGLTKNQGKLVDSSGQVTQSFKKSQMSATAFGSAVRGVSGAVGKLWVTYGQLLPLMGAYAVTAGSIATIKLGATFEYDTRYAHELSGGIDAANVSLEEMREQLQSFKGLRNSSVELADGMKEFAKAGVEVSVSLENIAEMSRFATVAEMGLAEATKLIIGQANAFGLSYAEAANKIAAAAMSSATTIQEMAAAMAHTTELGSISKISFDELAASLAVLANVGIRGGKAGRALRTGILRMQTPTKKLTEMMEGLNIEFSAFTEDGKIKKLGVMFKELDEATKNLVDEKRIALFRELFGLRALKGGANLLSAMNGKFDELKQKVEESAEGVTFLQKKYKEFTDTTKGQFELLKTAISNAMTKAFESDALKSAMKDLTAFINSGALTSSISNILSLLGSVFSILAKIGALLVELNNFPLMIIPKTGFSIASELLGTLKDIVTLNFSGVKKSLGDIAEHLKSAAASALPLKDVLVEAFGTDPTKEYRAAVEDFKSTLSSTEPIIVKYAEGVGAYFDETTSDLEESEVAFFEWSDSVDSAVRDVDVEPTLHAIGEAVSTISATLPEVAEVAVVTFTRMGAELRGSSEDFGENEAAVIEWSDNVSTAFRRAGESLTEFYSKQGSSELHDQLLEKILPKGLEKDALTIKNYLAGVAESAEEAGKQLGFTGTALKSYVSEMTSQAKITKELEAVEKAASAAKKDSSSASKELARQQKEEAKAAKEAEKAVAELRKEYEKYQKAIDAVNDVIESSNRAAYITSLTKEQKIHEEISHTLEEERAKLEAVNASNTVITQKMNELEAALYAAKEATGELGRASESFTAGFSAGLKEIKQEMKTLGEYGADLAHTLRDATADSFSTILKSSVYGLSEAKSEIENTLNDTLDAATETYNLALVELEASYAAGAIATEEYEANKLSILNEFNTQKMDAQTQYGEDIREAEDQLGTDLKDIWKGVLDSILDMGANWAADMVLTMGTNLVSELLSGDVWGKIGDFFAGLGGSISSLFEGDFSGAWDGVKSALGLGGGEGAMDVNVVSSVCCSEMAASLEDIVSGVDGLDSTMVETMGPAAKYLTQGLASAISTGVGTAASWAAGLYAAEMGVNEGTQLALIEGTYGPTSDAVTEGLASFDWGSAVGAAVAAAGVAAGGYGIYSGINSIAEGDYGTGAIQTGLGAASMYKGLVGLEVVESGTATAVYDSMVAYFGGAGAEVVSTAGVVGGGAADVAGLAAAEAGMSSGAAGSSGAAAAGAAAFTPALMAAGAALFAVVGKLTPSVSMYTDELVSASGRTLELIDFAWTEAEAKANFNDPAWVDAQLDTVAAYGTNVLSQDSYVEDMGYIHTSMSNTIAGAFEARVTDTQAISAETEYGGEQAAAIEQISDSLFTKLRDAYTALEIDATQYGDKLAQIALQMAGSTESFDTYVDAIAGHDVALADSSAMMQLASQAAGGSSAAFQNLISALITQGLTTQQATEAASTMAAVLYDQGAATSMATSAANDMSNAIQEFSDTDLNLEATAKLNVEVEGDADVTGSVGGGFSVSSGSSGGYSDSGGSSWSTGENALGAIYDYHARGGVMTQPTVFHVGGEAGTEGIIPLRSPDQMNIIEDKVNSLIEYLANKPEQPVVVNVKGDEKGLKRFIEVETDQHVVARNKRGLTTERVSY